MRQFVEVRGLDRPQRRLALAAGSPGVALSLDLELYDRRREAMLALIEAAVGRAPFSAWARYSESIGASKSEKLDAYLQVLYQLLEDVLILWTGAGGIRNPDIRERLDALAAAANFEWIRRAVSKVDDLAEFVRRNIQKSIALDALVLELRPN